jgi:hypothetical protein
MLYRDSFRDLYDSHDRAFHLETQDAYGVASENEQLQRWLAGEPTADPPDWQSWDAHVKDFTSGGGRIQRLRIVTEPHTDYTRFLLHHTERNVQAGEQVRYLPRHTTTPDDYTDDDWWLFDDAVLAFTLFTPEGEFAGGAITTDPVLVSRCAAVRDALWPRGTDYEPYLRDHS